LRNQSPIRSPNKYGVIQRISVYITRSFPLRVALLSVASFSVAFSVLTFPLPISLDFSGNTCVCVCVVSARVCVCHLKCAQASQTR